MTLEKKVAQKLILTGQTLAVAESCTGGLLTHRLTNISGSSKFLIAGIISYAQAAKIKLLAVPSSIIRKHGAVSQAVAKRMAQNIRQQFHCDFGVGITGIAGPTGGTKTKPVGLVYVAVSSVQKATCRKFLFKGNRLQNKTQAVDEALKMLLMK